VETITRSILHPKAKIKPAIAKPQAKIVEQHYSISKPDKITNKPQKKLIERHHSISKPQL
jgi:hypothetical protein